MTDKTTNAAVIVTIGGTDFSFTPTVTEFNNYVNEMMPDNKVAPMHRYLMRTVDKSQKDELNKLLNSVSGLTQDVFTTVTKEAKGGITVELKN